MKRRPLKEGSFISQRQIKQISRLPDLSVSSKLTKDQTFTTNNTIDLGFAGKLQASLKTSRLVRFGIQPQF